RRRARRDEHAARLRQAGARVRRADTPWRLSLSRPERRGAVRGPCAEPARAAALAAVERIEGRVLGSELEAALVELRLIRELRPPANARVARPDRYVWLRKRGDG